MTMLEVIFDGKYFVPTTPVDLPAGTKSVVIIQPAATVRSAMSEAEAERILDGDGTPLPWSTVEMALGHPRFQA